MLGIHQIEQRKRNISRIVFQHAGGSLAGVIWVCGFGGPGSQVSQGARAPVAQDCGCGLQKGDEGAAHSALFNPDGAIGKGEIGFLQIPVAGNRKELILEVPDFPAMYQRLENRFVDVPDLRPAVAG